MSETQDETRSFGDLKKEIGDAGPGRFAVRSRGRPEMDPGEAREKAERRKIFGSRLKALREAQGLTLAAAAEAAGIASARKLSQYETKCYPPGWVLTALAPVYNVSATYLAALKLSNSDPYTYSALFGDLPPEEITSEDED